jgi:hypothetical protein
MLPLLLLLCFGALELTMKILVAQKVEKLAATTADVVAQSEVATVSGMDQLLSATTDIMEPFDFGADGVVIISSVYLDEGAEHAVVNWRQSGGGTLVETSQLGAVGGTADLPDGFVLNEKENVIVAEVYYNYQPLWDGLFFDALTIYRQAFFKPRLGALTDAPTP